MKTIIICVKDLIEIVLLVSCGVIALSALLYIGYQLPADAHLITEVAEMYGDLEAYKLVVNLIYDYMMSGIRFLLGG